MNNSFNDLGIMPPILKALEEMGFEVPTEVQSKAIPHILNKEDLIVMSKTGSGKTAVFGIPMLQMTDAGAREPQGLILTPTRELAVQIDSDIKQMSKHLEHKTTAVYGQHNMNLEIQTLSEGASIVTGTPGRVFDHIHHGNLKTKHIRFLVLDEADRMLDMGFLDQVVKIIRTIPKDRVTLLFSATMPSEMRKICRDYMKNPETIEIESQTMTVDTIQQVYYRVNNNEKNTQLNRLLLIERPESCIIFCNTRFAVDRVQSFLSKKGYACQALHGDIPQARRLKTIQQFKQAEFPLLVATDVAARGIHVDSLSLVVNYDVPVEKDSYVHRIGRTGRAGNVGRALTLVTSDDIMSLYEIEEHIGTMIAEEELPTEAEFNEHRAEAEKWIQACSQKAKPSRTSLDFNNKETQKRSSRNTPDLGLREIQKKPSRTTSESNLKGIQMKQPKAASESNIKEAQKKPPQATFEPNLKGIQKNHPQTKSPQHYEEHKDRPSAVKMEHKTVIRTRTVHTGGQAVESVPTMQKSIIRPSADTKVAGTKSSTDMAQSPASTAKKPFLQRVLQRLFGK